MGSGSSKGRKTIKCTSESPLSKKSQLQLKGLSQDSGSPPRVGRTSPQLHGPSPGVARMVDGSKIPTEEGAEPRKELNGVAPPRKEQDSELSTLAAMPDPPQGADSLRLPAALGGSSSPDPSKSKFRLQPSRATSESEEQDSKEASSAHGGDSAEAHYKQMYLTLYG